MTPRQHLRRVTDVAWLLTAAAGGDAGLAAVDAGWDAIAAARLRLTRNQRIWRRFWFGHRHVLDRATADWPADRILLQLALDHADDSPVTRAAERWLASNPVAWLRYQRVHRPAAYVPSPVARTWALPVANPRLVALSAGQAIVTSPTEGGVFLVQPPAAPRRLRDASRPPVVAAVSLGDARWGLLDANGGLEAWRAGERTAEFSLIALPPEAGLVALPPHHAAVTAAPGGVPEVHGIFDALEGGAWVCPVEFEAGAVRVASTGAGKAVLVHAGGKAVFFDVASRTVTAEAAVELPGNAWSLQGVPTAGKAVVYANDHSVVSILDGASGRALRRDFGAGTWSYAFAGAYLVAATHEKAHRIDLRYHEKQTFTLPTFEGDRECTVQALHADDEGGIGVAYFPQAPVAFPAPQGHTSLAPLLSLEPPVRLSDGRLAYSDGLRVAVLDRQRRLGGVWQSPRYLGPVQIAAAPAGGLTAVAAGWLLELEPGFFPAAKAAVDNRRRRVVPLEAGAVAEVSDREAPVVWRARDGRSHKFEVGEYLRSVHQLPDGRIWLVYDDGVVRSLDADGTGLSDERRLTSFRRTPRSSQRVLGGTHLVAITHSVIATLKLGGGRSRSLDLPDDTAGGFAGDDGVWVSGEDGVAIWRFEPGARGVALRDPLPRFRPRAVATSAHEFAAVQDAELAVWSRRTGRRLWSAPCRRLPKPVHLEVAGDFALHAGEGEAHLIQRGRGCVASFTSKRIDGCRLFADGRAVIKAAEGYWLWTGEREALVDAPTFYERYADLAVPFYTQDPDARHLHRGGVAAEAWRGGVGLLREGDAAPASQWHAAGEVEPRVLYDDGRMVVDDGEGRLVFLRPVKPV